MIILAEQIFTLANIVFTIGTTLLFIKVIKNRNVLNDFDHIGSSLTTTAVFLMTIAYYLLNMLIPILFSIPTLIFWFFVSFYAIKHKYIKK